MTAATVLLVFPVAFAVAYWLLGLYLSSGWRIVFAFIFAVGCFWVASQTFLIVTATPEQRQRF